MYAPIGGRLRLIYHWAGRSAYIPLYEDDFAYFNSPSRLIVKWKINGSITV